MSELELHLIKETESKNEFKLKVLSMESDLARGKQAEQSIPPLKEKVSTLEKQYKEYLRSTENELNELKNINHSLTLTLKQTQIKLDETKHLLEVKTRECEVYRTSSGEREREVQQLNQSFEQSSRELAIIEGTFVMYFVVSFVCFNSMFGVYFVCFTVFLFYVVFLHVLYVGL
jgi:hypothetical protein